MRKLTTHLFLLAGLSLCGPAHANDYLAELCRMLKVSPEEIQSYPPHRTHMRCTEIKRSYRAERWESLEERLAAIPPTSAWSSFATQSYPATWKSLPESDVEKALSWTKAFPKSAWAACAVAQACTNRAWAARGTGFAPSVSQQGWATWGELIPKARQWVETALRLDPKLVWALSLRVHLDRCDPSGRAKSAAHYEAVKRVAPSLYSPHAEVFWLKLPRYGGTWAEAWAHVKAYAKERPEDAGTLRLLMQAHSVRVSELVRSRDPQVRSQGVRDYYSRADVRADLDAAIKRVRAAKPTSTLPASIARRLAVVRRDDAAAQQFAQELAEKGDVSTIVRIADMKLRRTKNVDEKLAAMRTILKGFSIMNGEARKALNRFFIGGTDATKARFPLLAFLLISSEGQLGKLSAEAGALRMLSDGVGVPAQPEKARALQRAAAERGNHWCAYHEGRDRLKEGEAESEGKAIRLLEFAAGKGVKQAVRDLVRAFLGQYAPALRDLSKASRWIAEAKRQQLPDVQAMGELLERARQESD